MSPAGNAHGQPGARSIMLLSGVAAGGERAAEAAAHSRAPQQWRLSIRREWAWAHIRSPAPQKV